MTVLPVERPGPMHSPFHPDLGAPDELSLDAAELRLAAQPTAASQARDFTRTQLRRWGLRELSDVCVLVVSEMTTNAIKATAVPHTPDGYACPHPSAPCACSQVAGPYPIVLRLRLTTVGLFAEVWDSSDGEPQITEAGEDDESGRGLQLVGVCTDEWGHYRSPARGKVVFGRWALPFARHGLDVVPRQPAAYSRIRTART
ncbi:ATP-binding protein [Streptosporangium sp. NPDC002544]|uniref:ATP-binding protein n=1 Tax=Streptosporangium sp. NPDC002544 TaxID=3154538 RepID=UPI003333CD2F